MECLLCNIWARMPYAAKYTTPTTVQDTEGALIVGYWIASRAKAVPRLCERHMTVLALLDTQEEQLEETVAPTQPAPAPIQQLNPPVPTAGVIPRHRKQVPRPLVPPITPLIAPPIKVAPPSEFKLGPGPLTNENSTTEQPPLPMVSDLSAPYKAKPGTPEGALEAANMPPEEGAKVTYPCPSCGKEVTTGDIHACEA